MDAETHVETELAFGTHLSLDALEERLASAARVLSRAPDTPLHFNLADVIWSDIGSLLFLACTLSCLKRRGVPVQLTLPEQQGRWDEPDSVRKARDFLKRWRFDSALSEAVTDYREILPAHQEEYFSDDLPLKFYAPAILRTQGETQVLLSCRLVEITHMTGGPVGGRRVSEEKIRSYVNAFLSQLSLEDRFREAIRKALRFSDQACMRFGSNILQEALLNTFEHPEASMSMIAMARQQKHLVIAVADNGMTIPDTIRTAFEQDQTPFEPTLSAKEDLELLKLGVESHSLEQAERAFRRDYEATDYATKPGKTSKPHIPRPKRGFGLTYVKNDTLDFGGYCVFRAGAASVRYFRKRGQEMRSGRAVSSWPGNLVKIFLPLAEEA